VLDLLKADLERYTEGGGFASQLSVALLNLGFQSVALFRVSRWLHEHGLAPLAAVVAYANSVYTGAQLSQRATIGRGFAIYHPRGVVVGGTAVLGEGCTLVHGNLIGQLYGGGDRPVIGNKFYAGSGSKVLGRITIGDDVTVGANGVVIQSLPSGVTVSGIPARIVYRRRPVPAPEPPAVPESHQARVVRVLQATVDPAATLDKIEASTPLLGAGVGMDSIELLRLVCALEEEFGLTIDETEITIDHFRTVGDLTAFLERRGAR